MVERRPLTLIDGRPTVLPAGDSLPGGGGGGSSSIFGTAEIDFGAYPGSNEASVAVTGQGAIASTAKVMAWIMADDTTTDHTAADHRYAAALIALSCSTPTNGVGFTIHGRCLEKITGKFALRWSWTA